MEVEKLCVDGPVEKLVLTWRWRSCMLMLRWRSCWWRWRSWCSHGWWRSWWWWRWRSCCYIGGGEVVDGGGEVLGLTTGGPGWELVLMEVEKLLLMEVEKLVLMEVEKLVFDRRWRSCWSKPGEDVDWGGEVVDGGRGVGGQVVLTVWRQKSKDCWFFLVGIDVLH